jgi:hypothetical protein
MAMMIPLFWLLMLVYGLSLLRASAKRNLGITLITLFFFPVLLYLIMTVIFQIFFDLSVVDLYRIGCGMNADYYTECYPEGYFMENK